MGPPPVLHGGVSEGQEALVREEVRVGRPRQRIRGRQQHRAGEEPRQGRQKVAVGRGQGEEGGGVQRDQSHCPHVGIESTSLQEAARVGQGHGAGPGPAVLGPDGGHPLSGRAPKGAQDVSGLEGVGQELCGRRNARLH